jgi:hypothetical protein
MAVYSHALWPLQCFGDIRETNGDGSMWSHDSCLVYLDDMIIIGRTFEEYLLNLRKVFQHFREARLKLNPEKYRLLPSYYIT